VKPILSLLYLDPFGVQPLARTMAERLALVLDDRHSAAYPIDMLRCDRASTD
jgi:hypothetical protein